MSDCRSDFVTSYFLAFSNDSREWITIHDGYADWVSSHKVMQFSCLLPPTLTNVPHTSPSSSSCSLETVIRTLRWWTSWQSLCWLATSASSLKAGTALCVWGWRSWAALCLVSFTNTCIHMCLKTEITFMFLSLTNTHRPTWCWLQA